MLAEGSEVLLQGVDGDCPCRQVNHKGVAAAVPLFRGGKVSGGGVNSRVTPELHGITDQDCLSPR